MRQKDDLRVISIMEGKQMGVLDMSRMRQVVATAVIMEEASREENEKLMEDIKEAYVRYAEQVINKRRWKK